MRLILAALAAFLFFAAPAPVRASEASDIIAGIEKMTDAYNKHDDAALAATFTSAPVIIDDFAPFAWSGPTSLSDWSKAEAADNAASAITNPRLTIARPTYASVDGDRGYAVANGRWNFVEQGRRQVETGVVTLSMQKSGDAWLISGMSWARR